MTASASDLLQLAKPRITALVVFTTAIGLWLAPHGLRPVTVALTLVGTVLIVAAANVLNMYLERDSDAMMTRTMNRPLPAHRMDPGLALRFGLVLAAVSVPLLTFAVGALPGLLAAIALVSYVLLYTPMKRQTATALLVGALPGAIPPLIGWTAATERLDLPGVLLFAVMFLWQVPHFLAITLFRRTRGAAQRARRRARGARQHRPVHGRPGGRLAALRPHRRGPRRVSRGGVAARRRVPWIRDRRTPPKGRGAVGAQPLLALAGLPARPVRRAGDRPPPLRAGAAIRRTESSDCSLL
jgi:uncharacterized membrane protein